ncbi:MAG: glycoside hydrolase [Puniceicoccaceae bacterium 5H]|nr:MAG: glycoside hydrolase [Puniceicoccaceae bacterium 5H]
MPLPRPVFAGSAKPLALAASFFGSVLSLQAAVASFGQPRLLVEDWKFQLGDVPSAQATDFDDAAWRVLDVPHDWSVEGVADPELASCTGYLPGGIGWYRKTLEIPSDAVAGNKVYLYFEGVYNRSSVYLNGHLLGKRPNGYVSFIYDATPYVNFDGPNTLAVRVDHSQSADSRWYTGSGIYRDVWLVRAHDVHIRPWGVFAYPAEVGEDAAVVRVQTELVNESDQAAELTVRQELYNADGRLVSQASTQQRLAAGSQGQGELELPVEHPQLWSLEAPNLYTLKTVVERDGEVVDRTETRTGIREFSFDPDTGFALNGERMKMKGVCLHHDAGVLGAAVPSEVWRKRLETLKSIGVNAIRTSHNPQATDLYELCDEMGLLVLNEAFDEWEFPKRKWLDGWNVGEPGFQGSYDFFDEWSSRDLADMVRRDRNHPSVFTWSIGNEVDYPNDPYSHPVLDGTAITQPMFGGYDPDRPDANRLGDIAQRLAGVVRGLDPSRPVTAALAGVVMSNETAYPGAVDITGYNYTESRYQTDHELFPERVIYGSETRHDYQAWLAVRDNAHIFGQFIWTGIDYLGEAGAWPSRGLYTGMLDFGGFVKPRGRFREALWAEHPAIYLGTTARPQGERQSIDAWPIWDYADGKQVRVHCYTNAAEAELFLNGKRVGRKLAPNPQSGILTWDIPYQDGRLEVVGYDASGKEHARTVLQTPGEPERMEVTCDTPLISSERGVAMITVQIVDAEGTRVMDAEPAITCTVEGPGRLLGLEASNNTDMSDYNDNVHRAYHGRILAYVQAKGQPGEVTVRFEAKGLPSQEIRLESRPTEVARNP